MIMIDDYHINNFKKFLQLSQIMFKIIITIINNLEILITFQLSNKLI